MNIVYAPRALRDLKDVAAYLIDRSPLGARNTLAAIQSSIDTLTVFPKIGCTIDAAGHRRLPVLRFPYVIFYRIAEGDVLILHIRHTSRRPIDPASEL